MSASRRDFLAGLAAAGLCGAAYAIDSFLHAIHVAGA